MGSAAGWWAERYMRGDCCRLSLVVSGAEQERKGNPWGSASRKWPRGLFFTSAILLLFKALPSPWERRKGRSCFQ